MINWARIRNKLWFLFRRDRFERDMAEEMDFHRSMLEADKTDPGLDRQFGNTALACEASRQAWTIEWLDTLVRDIGYSRRMWLRQPSFALVAILTLALGIGANTAIFTLI